LELFDIDPDFPLSDPARIVAEPDCSAMGRIVAADARGEHPEFAAQRGILVPGHGCLAVPVRRSDNSLIAVLAASAPAHRVAEPATLVAFLTPYAQALALACTSHVDDRSGLQ
jgi:hypothetical protein